MRGGGVVRGATLISNTNVHRVVPHYYYMKYSIAQGRDIYLGSCTKWVDQVQQVKLTRHCLTLFSVGTKQLYKKKTKSSSSGNQKWLTLRGPESLGAAITAIPIAHISHQIL